MKENVERTPLNARVSVRICQAFDVEIAKKRISKQQAVEEAIRLWITAQLKQSEGLPVRAPILAAGARGTYTLSQDEIDDAVFGGR